MASITMKQLLESGIHFGHQTRRWNPKMARYIFGERHGIYILDLQKTIKQLQKAYRLVRDTAADGGNILFVGTKKQAQEPIQQHAERCGMYYVNNRWLGGTLTNWVTIQQSIDKLVRLDELFTTGKIEQYTKKEAVVMNREREKLNKNLSGIKGLDRQPGLMFVIDTVREKIAVAEAKRLGIPCIGICDTNSDPDVVDVAVPGNDDAIRAIQLYCQIVSDAVLDGHSRFEKEQAEGHIVGTTKITVKSKLTKGQSKVADDDASAADAPVADAPVADAPEAGEAEFGEAEVAAVAEPEA